MCAHSDLIDAIGENGKATTDCIMYQHDWRQKYSNK